MWSACSAQMSPQVLQAIAHASSIARVRLASYPVWRESICPVAKQMSAQSRFERMHLVSEETSSSLRQASAHAVHACAQA